MGMRAPHQAMMMNRGVGDIAVSILMLVCNAKQSLGNDGEMFYQSGGDGNSGKTEDEANNHGHGEDCW